jgi:Zn-dependent protease with chaperone function
LLDRLGATFVPKGEWLPTKMALKDMAIASGLQVSPSLWALDTPNVNAFVFAAPGHRPVLGVTRGFVERFSVAEQRAVFANLVARIVSGDIAVSSTVASLLAPLQWYRSYRLTIDREEDARLLTTAAEAAQRTPQAGNAGCAVVPFILAAFPAVIATELLAALQRRSHLIASEKADAEGMLLLKDPRVMLSALERAIRFNNNVVEADEALGDLFYCWTGDSTDDDTDPEWHRGARLREVLGVEGWVEPQELVDLSDVLPPPAPRLEE